MEATFRKIIQPADSSFIVKMDNIPAKNPWHYHPECEIILFLEAKGTRFVGDNIEAITESEILLLGENLPHTTQRDRRYYDNHPHITPQVIIVQFHKDFLGKALWGKTEFLSISELLNKAARGLRFTGKTAERAKHLLLQIAEQKGIRRIILLLSVLEELAQSGQSNYLSSCGFLKYYDETDEKINKVYEFTINNFMEDISLERIASLVFLSQSAFCRYFKNKTMKTYNQFLTEIRIGYACKLLLQGKLNISEICYECGYKNLSNFNRHFKDILQITPSEYFRSFEATSKYELAQ
jgi:AraC-like DNA-binding protein